MVKFQSLHLVWDVLWTMCNPVHGACTEHKQEHNWKRSQSYKQLSYIAWVWSHCSLCMVNTHTLLQAIRLAHSVEKE